MKVLVTGSKGFIGKNLILWLKENKEIEILEYDRETEEEVLEEYCSKADFVYHLAGVNRPIDVSEYMEGNFTFIDKLLEKLKKYNNYCPILLSSSIQATLDNPYGISKKAGEDILIAYEKEYKAKVLIYRLQNVFGKWCKPNYNSAVSTFCYNRSRNIPIYVSDREKLMELIYIDDVIEEFIRALYGNEDKEGNYCKVAISHQVTLGFIVDTLNSFYEERKSGRIPNLSDTFVKKLYSTYLSYLPEDEFSYPLHMNIDNRGSFTEFIKTEDRGQVSINISKPGVVKGNHWHNTKVEKFLVVSGKGVIRFRKLNTDKIIEYYVSDKILEVVDIPVGYTHNIENLGDSDMVTIMWVNEIYDSKKPDTYYQIL
jgi:UDP-2-acetamido-2,6-beta-L-arabino-hexul-4-ose reductase